MVSLIVATLNRVTELDKLLESLEVKQVEDFEVVIVDQNSDDRLVPIVKRHSRLAVSHLRARPGGSHARNVGLRAAQGDIIAFPDDDCWYPGGFIGRIGAWFDEHREMDAVFARLSDEELRPLAPKSPARGCLCTRENLWFVGFTGAVFLRRGVTSAVGFFDEGIGIGASSGYQSGEDVDYALRCLRHGFKVWFEPSLTVHHPAIHDPGRLRRTTYGYALGGAYVQRKHGYSLGYFLCQVARSIGGAVFSVLKLDFPNLHIYLLRAAGQLRGYFWGPRDMARYRAQNR